MTFQYDMARSGFRNQGERVRGHEDETVTFQCDVLVCSEVT